MIRSGMQDKSIHVLCTKEIDDQLIAQAAAFKILIDVVPFINTKPVNPFILKSQFDQLSQAHTTVIFTSANAVSAVAASGIATTGWELFSVSGATKQAAQQAFPYANIRAVTDDGVSLAAAIIQSGIRENIVYCCGNKRRDVLPTMLKEKGIRLEEVVCYETELLPRHVERTYDAILFFSPSGVASYLSANGIAPSQTLFCIGNTTAGALQQWEEKLVVADRPEPKNLIEKMIRHYKLGLSRYE